MKQLPSLKKLTGNFKWKMFKLLTSRGARKASYFLDALATFALLVGSVSQGKVEAKIETKNDDARKT